MIIDLGKVRACLLGIIIATGAAGYGATYNVTSTADSGAGSLRAAIALAGANPGEDNIHFNISGSGVRTIELVTGLEYEGPDALTIDGTTQPGYSGSPLIEIKGDGSIQQGLVFYYVDGGNIKGLCLHGFAFGIELQACFNCTIQSCYIGVDPTGTIGMLNSFTNIGVSYGGTDNVIGGSGAGEGNVLGLSNSGLDIMSSSRTIVKGNFIGTNPAGTGSFSLGKGIRVLTIAGASDDTIIGGLEAGAGNVIVNAGFGIENNGNGTLIQGNRIGVTSTDNIAANGTAITSVEVITVGGTVASQGNIIAYTNKGVAVGPDALGSRILGNRFFGSNNVAIDMMNDGTTANDSPDANGITNSPVLGASDIVSAPGQVTIPTTLTALPFKSYMIEYYYKTPDGMSSDFLGRATRVTDGSGTVTFDASFAYSGPTTNLIVATATPTAVEATGTSEFSGSVVAPVELSGFMVE